MDKNKETSRRNYFLITTLGDFNLKSTNWYNKGRKRFESNRIEKITSQLGLHWLINEPKDILENSYLCIYQNFTSQPAFVFESGVHSSLDLFCHHQIAFAKFNLKIYYPPSFSREIWHFKEAETVLTRRALNDFNWKKVFLNTNANRKVRIFNKYVINLYNNFISHETILWDDKNLPWFNSPIKSLFQTKNSFQIL